MNWRNDEAPPLQHSGCQGFEHPTEPSRPRPQTRSVNRFSNAAAKCGAGPVLACRAYWQISVSVEAGPA